MLATMRDPINPQIDSKLRAAGADFLCVTAEYGLRNKTIAPKEALQMFDKSAQAISSLSWG